MAHVYLVDGFYLEETERQPDKCHLQLKRLLDDKPIAQITVTPRPRKRINAKMSQPVDVIFVEADADGQVPMDSHVGHLVLGRAAFQEPLKHEWLIKWVTEQIGYLKLGRHLD